MSSRAIRVGIVGCGRIWPKHLAVIERIEGLELVAICERAPERLVLAGEKCSAARYSDYREMLDNEELDLVSILTESGSHAEIGIEAAPHVSSLVIEKPLALTLESTDALIETCDAHQTRLFVVKQNRYNPPVVRLREALDAGRFGKLVLGTVRVRWCRHQSYYDQDVWRGTWRHDGGVFANQASHHIDLLQWMMGPVESVQAYSATRLVDIETEDTGVAILRFTSGALGIIEATTATRPTDLEGSHSILGELGSVEIGGFAVNELRSWNFVDSRPEDDDVFESSVYPPNVYGFGHQAFYEDVAECILTGKHSMLDGLAGRRTLELINAIYESAATGGEVRLHYKPRNVRLGREER
ncbi:MAG TPA: Gfo/Idh/MocA family oxidoreductase [Thermoanaerobaculia bacterium]|nr:Gfo/Idh/MocA family oxidoreductase [Thermoanaerobaculia bacterium]